MLKALVPSRLLRVSAAALLTATAACGSGGDTDDAEMSKDPSTQPTTSVVPDSSTQVAPGPTMTATATAQGATTGATVAPADSSKSRGPIVGTPTKRP